MTKYLSRPLWALIILIWIGFVAVAAVQNFNFASTLASTDSGRWAFGLTSAASEVLAAFAFVIAAVHAARAQMLRFALTLVLGITCATWSVWCSGNIVAGYLVQRFEVIKEQRGRDADRARIVAAMTDSAVAQSKWSSTVSEATTARNVSASSSKATMAIFEASQKALQDAERRISASAAVPTIEAIPMSRIIGIDEASAITLGVMSFVALMHLVTAFLPFCLTGVLYVSPAPAAATVSAIAASAEPISAPAQHTAAPVAEDVPDDEVIPIPVASTRPGDPPAEHVFGDFLRASTVDGDRRRRLNLPHLAQAWDAWAAQHAGPQLTEMQLRAAMARAGYQVSAFIGGVPAYRGLSLQAWMAERVGASNQAAA